MAIACCDSEVLTLETVRVPRIGENGPQALLVVPALTIGALGGLIVVILLSVVGIFATKKLFEEFIPDLGDNIVKPLLRPEVLVAGIVIVALLARRR